MNARISKPLPAPHDAIYVEVERLWWGFHIEYRGPDLAALLAAGCVSQDIVDRLNRPNKGRTRTDSDGDHFSRTQRQRSVTVCRRIRTDKAHDGVRKAIALPGVAAYLAEHQPEESRSRADVAAARVADALDVTFTQKRTRTVGRFQRPVRWISAGQVIFPDWPSIRAQAAQGAA